MKKILKELMYFSFVAVPVMLLMWGLLLYPSPLSDVVFVAATAVFILLTGMMSRKVWQKTTEPEAVAVPVAYIGMLVAFAALVFQALYCRLSGNLLMPLEGAMTWMFLVIVCSGFRQMFVNPPRTNKSLITAIFCGLVFLAVCTIGGLFDLFEYFTELEIPQRVGDFFAVIAPLSAIGCILFLIIGLIQDKLSGR